MRKCGKMFYSRTGYR